MDQNSTEARLNLLGLLVADHVTVMLAYWDRNLMCRFANSAYYNWFGKTRDDMVDKITIQGLVGPAVYKKNLPYILRALDGENQTFEREIILPDGSIGFSLVNYFPDIVNGEVIGFFAVVNDITGQKTVEEKLRLSEEAFRGAFEYSATGMALVGTDGKWIRVNQSVTDILGYTNDELMNLTFQDITHPDDLNTDLHLLKELLAGQRMHYHLEKRYFHKDGHIVWVILAVSLVKDLKGNPLYCVSQLTDITQRKITEEKLQNVVLQMEAVLELTNDQNKRLLNFAHIVSHNLRSHSSNLKMLLDYIKIEDNEDTRREMFGMLNDAASNLQDTITHLNEVVAINTSLHDNLKTLNLRNAVNSAIGNITALLAEVDATCINNVDKDTEVEAFPAYLDSVLLNVLTNAIKYRSEERALVIEITAYRLDDFVVLSIKDNGLGLDLEKNGDKIFGMYKTFHGNKDARGIGLFITKNQVEAMGGRMEVESVVDEGSVFRIFLR